jgi:hypothetical protein
MSRPEIPIDWEKVDFMLEAGSNGASIAARIGMHPNTFYDRVLAKYGIGFTEYATLKRSIGDDNLREGQYRKALKKLDNTMLIWLGKQRLGQKENASEKVVPEDVLKAFELLMQQLNQAQEERSRSVECKVEQSEIPKEEPKLFPTPSVPSSASIHSITQFCRESPFR